MSLWHAARRAALALLLGGAAATTAQAGSLRYCDEPEPLSAAQQDRMLRFAALIKTELQRSGQRLAIVSRSGLDLDWLGQRYSHAGVALQDSAVTPWSVRQLYFACEAKEPRLYDQGLAGFILGAGNPRAGFVSVLLLPPDKAQPLAQAALDNGRALQLLGAQYSANAYAFGTLYQNCNQWLVELLAATWGQLPAGPDLRPRAQAWLRQAGYEPTVFQTNWGLMMWVSRQISWLHADDHPQADLDQRRYRVSMPASIEALVMASAPGTQRLEFCHNSRHALLRRGGPPIADGCVAEPGDELTLLD